MNYDPPSISEAATFKSKKYGASQNTPPHFLVCGSRSFDFHYHLIMQEEPLVTKGLRTFFLYSFIALIAEESIMPNQSRLENLQTFPNLPSHPIQVFMGDNGPKMDKTVLDGKISVERMWKEGATSMCPSSPIPKNIAIAFRKSLGVRDDL
ncbi:hypothetical protein AYI68_g49 [Smittium mucronatum]|uniref:Uncharacterized protein n=1 Tax=Smittium mucronatum TaxID=133383 RepID=A0A1R0H9G1_9FUNG|nr:hypothetical protein AYI68_g49 [Smittium mucronatum]